MRFPQRRKVADVPPGVTATVHSHRDLRTLLERDLRGGIVVLEHRDLDAETARILLARGPLAVLNAAEFISGRFANLGPEVLVLGGVTLFEGDRASLLGLTDGSPYRLHENTVYDGAVVVADLHPVDAAEVQQRMETARTGLATQLETFAHTTSELLRQEEDILLHGRGVPELRVRVQDRPVIVVGPAAQPDQLKPLRSFLRQEKPVLIAVDGGAEAAVARKLRPDAVILSGAGTVQPKTLARCREVVLTGSGEAVRRRAQQANIPVHEVPTSIAALDLGLLVAHAAGARVLIPVGYPSSLDDFIDRGRSAQASNVLARLRVGSRLVEASAVPALYSGRVRRWQVGVTVLIALGALGLSVATTPVGQDWWTELAQAWETWR